MATHGRTKAASITGLEGEKENFRIGTPFFHTADIIVVQLGCRVHFGGLYLCSGGIKDIARASTFSAPYFGINNAIFTRHWMHKKGREVDFNGIWCSVPKTSIAVSTDLLWHF